MIDHHVAAKSRELSFKAQPETPAWWNALADAIGALRRDIEFLIKPAERTARAMDHVAPRSADAGRPDDAATAWLLRAIKERGWSLRGTARALVAAGLAEDLDHELDRLKKAKKRAK